MTKATCFGNAIRMYNSRMKHVFLAVLVAALETKYTEPMPALLDCDLVYDDKTGFDN